MNKFGERLKSQDPTECSPHRRRRYGKAGAFVPDKLFDHVFITQRDPMSRRYTKAEPLPLPKGAMTSSV